MRYPRLPLSALSPWTKLHDVTLYDIDIRDLGPEKGSGLATTRTLSSEETFDIPTLLNVPADLILCAKFVEEHAKVDQHFRQLLDVFGGKSVRGDIILFLLLQLTINSPDCPIGVGISNPWTEFVRMLPSNVPVPSTWTEEQAMLLLGTSLESAVSAKSAALQSEFEELRALTTNISWCYKVWWETDALDLDDWQLLDAWYRSRCLELPQAGESMVPCLDMANHSGEPNAYYEQSKNADVILLLRQGVNVGFGEEITINYGSSKSAAEMLFSYGFVDESLLYNGVVLGLLPFPNDPLGKAKLAAFPGKPSLSISDELGVIGWNSEFIFFMCLNEEDGLDFRVLQENDGTRGELKVFWRDEDVTSQTDNFRDLIESHPLKDVFMLRVIATLQDRLQQQLERIYESEETVSRLASVLSAGTDEGLYKSALTLRRRETRLMEQAYGSLDEQKSTLGESPVVLEYLKAMGGDEAASGSGEGEGLHEDEDFS